jgi:hypothetical protein
MELTLNRARSAGGSTLGELFVDGNHECWTCEDVVREIPGVPVEKWKIKGQTAIPSGRYKVLVTHSTRFQRLLPLLCDVPGFGGIRIHAGNTAADTEGCILPGAVRAGVGVANSRIAFEALFSKIQDALKDGQQVWITINNAPAVVS